MVRTYDHKVLGLNPAGGRIQLMTEVLHFTEPIIITFPSSPYDLTLVLLNPDILCICKQCRSRSVGFLRSQLIWICTVCHLVYEFMSTIWIKESDWLKIRNGRGILIYSAGQGLNNVEREVKHQHVIIM